jgi:thiosulfate/3-mercaptopyruvate sulfurtransferase
LIAPFSISKVSCEGIRSPLCISVATIHSFEINAETMCKELSISTSLNNCVIVNLDIRYLPRMAKPLITADELAPLIAAQTVRIIDCRWYLGEPEEGYRAFADGHIPNALYASLDTDLSGQDGQGRHPLPSPEIFARTLERFGISASTRVVAYDDGGGAVASRLWWMLTDQGHGMTSVLNGGIQAWTRSGGALTTTIHEPQPGTFSTRPWSGIVHRDQVASRSEDTPVIDARSGERYRGDEEPVDPKAGHIPGALSLPLDDNLASDLTFLPPSVLRERFSDAGVADAKKVISQCGSGVTACHNILAFEVAGIRRPDLYVGSWSDWSSSDLPVATGPTP